MVTWAWSSNSVKCGYFRFNSISLFQAKYSRMLRAQRALPARSLRAARKSTVAILTEALCIAVIFTTLLRCSSPIDPQVASAALSATEFLQGTILLHVLPVRSNKEPAATSYDATRVNAAFLVADMRRRNAIKDAISAALKVIVMGKRKSDIGERRMKIGITIEAVRASSLVMLDDQTEHDSQKLVDLLTSCGPSGLQQFSVDFLAEVGRDDFLVMKGKRLVDVTFSRGQRFFLNFPSTHGAHVLLSSTNSTKNLTNFISTHEQNVRLIYDYHAADISTGLSYRDYKETDSRLSAVCNFQIDNNNEQRDDTQSPGLVDDVLLVDIFFPKIVSHMRRHTNWIDRYLANFVDGVTESEV